MSKKLLALILLPISLSILPACSNETGFKLSEGQQQICAQNIGERTWPNHAFDGKPFNERLNYDILLDENSRGIGYLYFKDKKTETSDWVLWVDRGTKGMEIYRTYMYGPEWQNTGIRLVEKRCVNILYRTVAKYDHDIQNETPPKLDKIKL